MHMPFLVLEQALSNGCCVLFQPVMVPLPAMGMGNSWFMLFDFFFFAAQLTEPSFL